MDENQEKNKNHYEKIYRNYSLKNIFYWVNNVDSFLNNATACETSWYALYKDDLKERVKGKKVLEMGCGDCVNSAVMAALGAEVYANDIAIASGEIIRELNEKFSFDYPITFVEGDFLENELPEKNFDFVIGKAFLHHLTVPLERMFINETSRLLKDDGEARFFEPAVNSQLLDVIRWHIPVKGRPSKFSKKSFKKWKEKDPHPDRPLSSGHFFEVGKEHFGDVKILPVGTIERFSKLIKWGRRKNNFKRWALKNESLLPTWLNEKLTKSQLIIYSKPI